MPELDKAKNYWDLISKAAPVKWKDHWVDEHGEPLDDALFDEIAEFVLAYIPESLTRPRILEVGCGTGRILGKMSGIRRGLDLWGIDFSDEQIKTAREQIGGRCNLFVGDLNEFNIHTDLAGDNGFDLIFLHGVTQYFPSDSYLQEFIDTATSIIKPGGGLVLLDCPITWYLEQMRGVQKSTITYHFKSIVKLLIRYKPKSRAKTMKEVIANVEIEVPKFSGYWIDPENIKQLCSRDFESLKMEFQTFIHKPVSYKKYRPNFIFTLKR